MELYMLTNGLITMSIPNYANATGTFRVEDLELGAAYAPSSSAGIVAAHGVITLTSISPNFEGTFSFTCVDSTKVTGGTFSTKAP